MFSFTMFFFELKQSVILKLTPKGYQPELTIQMLSPSLWQLDEIEFQGNV